MVARLDPFKCPSSDVMESSLEEWMQEAGLLLEEDSKRFLRRLGLPHVHPRCTLDRAGRSPEAHASIASLPTDFWQENDPFSAGGGEFSWDTAHTLWAQVAPALLAMGELWLRLLSALFAPLCFLYLLTQEIMHQTTTTTTTTPPGSRILQQEQLSSQKKRHGMACVVGVASSAVLLTDSLYVHQNDGRWYGLLCFIPLVILSTRSCIRWNRTYLWSGVIFPLVCVTAWLLYQSVPLPNTKFPYLSHPGLDVPFHIPEGLYHSSHNSLVQTIVKEWPEHQRTYSSDTDATPWLPTGDSKTGIPFLVNANRIPSPTYHRVWLPSPDDDNDDDDGDALGEILALDIAFPSIGSSVKRSGKVFLVLHGLNGGSHEDYVMDFTNRRIKEGSTVVVMVARGLMDVPMYGWNVFHGARISDVNATAHALRRACTDGEETTLAGVGYSMGAIILSHYVAASGKDCALDAAMAISGGLDMRQQLNFFRSMRLWQPMLAKELKEAFVLGKFESRYRSRLSKQDFSSLLRATHITSIDEYAVVTYNGFDDLTHYYTSMSAMGDLDYNNGTSTDHIVRAVAKSQISQVAIPFCVLHALDDPLVSWRTIVPPPLKDPQLLAESGSGHLLLLLTKGGGHVGWPLGMFPHVHSWKWMNDAAQHFVHSVHTVRSQSQPTQHSNNP